MNLREYQIKGVDDFLASVSRRVLMVAPTGSGKTVVAAEIMKRYHAEFKNVLFVVHRWEIIQQTSAKLRAFGVPHGIISAASRDIWRSSERVQVASIQTLYARAIKNSRMEMPPADLVVIDEAHHACAKTYRAVCEKYPDAKILGLTATPCRGDGRGLGDDFDAIIELPQVADLIEMKHLVKPKVYAPANGGPDLTGVRVQSGDYAPGELSRRMNTDRLVGNAIAHYLRLGEARKAVVFAVDVAHSVHLRDEFVKVGVRAEQIDGKTPVDEREKTLARLERGDIQVVVNCMVLTEGWDMPDVGCCILARPTKKLGMYRQMVGRVLRPAEGKANAIILDHSGAWERLGLPDDHIEWTLDPDCGATNATQAAREASPGGSRIVECFSCGVMRAGGMACWACGAVPPKRPVEYQVSEGDLGLVDRGAVKARTYDAATRRQWHAMLLYIARERGAKPGMAAYRYKDKFGEWPPRHNIPEPIEPAYEVRQWDRSRRIAYAKALQKGRAA